MSPPRGCRWRPTTPSTRSVGTSPKQASSFLIRRGARADASSSPRPTPTGRRPRDPMVRYWTWSVRRDPTGRLDQDGRAVRHRIVHAGTPATPGRPPTIHTPRVRLRGREGTGIGGGSIRARSDDLARHPRGLRGHGPRLGPSTRIAADPIHGVDPLGGTDRHLGSGRDHMTLWLESTATSLLNRSSKRKAPAMRGLLQENARGRTRTFNRRFRRPKTDSVSRACRSRDLVCLLPHLVA